MILSRICLSLWNLGAKHKLKPIVEYMILQMQVPTDKGVGLVKDEVIVKQGSRVLILLALQQFHLLLILLCLPKCGFSRKVLDILEQEKVEYKSFDVLTDTEVRQGLKVHSNWSSYPQLYIKGELIGGSDVVLEMQKSGELRRVLADKGVIIPHETLDDRLTKLVSSSPVMLFMKGTPDAPKCGFSSKVVNALTDEGVTFGSFDILSDDAVRQGLKTFSNWPTYPQLYYKGELIGGCDIILEMKNNGELKSIFSE